MSSRFVQSSQSFDGDPRSDANFFGHTFGVNRNTSNSCASEQAKVTDDTTPCPFIVELALLSRSVSCAVC
jgi:hypothetical protein